MNALRRVRWACALAALLVVSGCLPVPIPPLGIAPDSRSNLPPTRPGFIHEGETQRADVLLALGAPDRAGADERWFAYASAAHQGGVAFVVGSYGGAGGVLVEGYLERRLVIRFDERGIVESVEFEEKVCPRVGLNEHGRTACLDLTALDLSDKGVRRGRIGPGPLRARRLAAITRLHRSGDAGVEPGAPGARLSRHAPRHRAFAGLHRASHLDAVRGRRRGHGADPALGRRGPVAVGAWPRRRAGPAYRRGAVLSHRRRGNRCSAQRRRGECAPEGRPRGTPGHDRAAAVTPCVRAAARRPRGGGTGWSALAGPADRRSPPIARWHCRR